MAETFTALLTAHLVGDFVFQSDRMVRTKARPGVLLLHATIVTFLSWFLLGFPCWPILLAVFLTHAGIDGIKTRATSDTLRVFLLDQAAHLAVLVILAYGFPEGATRGWWVKDLPSHLTPWYFAGLSLISGMVLTVNVGGVVIGKATRGFVREIWSDQIHGLTDGGKTIGYLERSLVLLLELTNQAAGIGFLIAAKSILRFGEITGAKERKFAEYVIIGTFMSFGWALLVSALVREAVGHWLNW